MNKKSVNKYISHVGEVIKLIDDLVGITTECHQVVKKLMTYSVKELV